MTYFVDYLTTEIKKNTSKIAIFRFQILYPPTCTGCHFMHAQKYRSHIYNAFQCQYHLFMQEDAVC